MAGLLDGFSEFIKTPEGQGLLAATFGGLAGAQRGAPLNSLGRAGLAGLSGYGGALDRQTQQAEAAQMGKYRDMQSQTMQMQIDAAKKKAADAASLRALQQRFSIPAKPANDGGLPSSFTSALPPELQTGVTISPMAAQPASFDREGFGKAWEAIDPIAGFNYQQGIQKDNTPISVAAGTTLLDKKTMKPVFSNPKEDSTDPKIKQYEYAKAGGYKGTFEQFVTLGPALMAAAAAPLRNAQTDNITQENAYNLPPPRTSQAASGGVSVTLPDGRVATFKDQKAANGFKMKAGIK